MKRLFLLILLALLTLSIFSCNSSTTSQKSAERKTLSLQFIDSSVRPGDDFYRFANGKWLDTATVPPSEARSGARIEMDYKTRAEIKGILEDASKENNTKGSIEQKVGDIYASGMDTAAIEKAGYDPVKPMLQEIAEIKDAQGVMRFVAEQYTDYNPMLIGAYVGSDDKNSSKNILIFYQSGLGLPDRDYYFKNDPATLDVIKSYQNYIFKLFRLTGDDSLTAEKNVISVYNFQKQMASSHRTNVELRDPQSNYNKMSVDDLDKKMPAIGWKELLSNLHIKTDSINLSQPAYYAKLNELLQTVPIDTWKIYLRISLLDDISYALSSGFVSANFEYYDKTLNGVQKMKPRWEIMYGVIDVLLGDALGQLYVEKYFSADAKKRITDLVNNLQKAFGARMDKLDWMSDSTKQKAKEKLFAITKKVGYTDKWRDYSGVTINRNSYFENILSCEKNVWNFQVSKIDKPVDRSEWSMTPPTNDAYYDAAFNEIVFPAGILQSPMFDPNADDALNYGAIGEIIGHEMTHGFDDQGAQYDKYGNLKNWWSKEDYAKFKLKGEALVKEYNSFTVFDTMHVNGQLTQGENTADNGGIAIAYDAFKLTKEGQDTTKIDGFTPDQRFFLAFAQAFRIKRTDAALRQLVLTDPHSPSNYRILGPLKNFAPFYAAFNVKEGDKMFVPDDKRVKIW